MQFATSQLGATKSYTLELVNLVVKHIAFKGKFMICLISLKTTTLQLDLQQRTDMRARYIDDCGTYV